MLLHSFVIVEILSLDSLGPEDLGLSSECLGQKGPDVWATGNKEIKLPGALSRNGDYFWVPSTSYILICWQVGGNTNLNIADTHFSVTWQEKDEKGCI